MTTSKYLARNHNAIGEPKATPREAAEYFFREFTHEYVCTVMSTDNNYGLWDCTRSSVYLLPGPTP